MTLHATVKGYESGTEHKIWGQKMFEIAFAESLRQHRNIKTECCKMTWATYFVGSCLT